MTTVVSIKIRRELKEEAEKLGIDIDRVVEKALIKEICRVKLEKFREMFEEMLKSMNISIDDYDQDILEEFK